MKKMKRVVASSVPLLAMLLGAGCGYALAGRGNALPSHVQSIGVPQFVNQSSTPDIDRVLTDAVRAELQTKGRYRVLPESSGVDAVLTGTVTNVTLRPLAFTGSQQVSRYAIITTANVEFKDVRDNRVLWSNPSFQSTDEYDLTTGIDRNDPSAIFTQDASAMERLSKNFARTIVTSIFEAF